MKQAAQTITPRTIKKARNKTLAPIRTTPLPQITAISWCIHLDSGEFLWGKNFDKAREMASLTKMMTCLVVCRSVDAGLASYENIVTVSVTASRQIGTSANLLENDQLTVYDLLLGMMLPSGNDAAWALAEHFGRLFLATSPNLYKKQKSTYGVAIFAAEMTRTARLLGLKKSKFANPHGLACMRNKASAKNLGKIAVSLLKHSVASRIVSTQEYTCKITNMNKTRYATWNNTNILLDSNEVTGVKTGNTPTAGPCLVAEPLNGAGERLGGQHIGLRPNYCTAVKAIVEAKGPFLILIIK